MMLEIIVGTVIGLSSGRLFVYLKRRFSTKTTTTELVPIKKAMVVK